MKNHNKYRYAAWLGCLAMGASLASCNDWLTLYPMDKIVEENFWEDKKDLESVRNAAYANMVSGPCMERYMVWGELRSDNFDKNSGVTLGDDIQDVLNVNLKPQNNYYKWSDFYSTINYCNKVLQHGPEILKKDKSFSQVEWEGMRAEMITLRALNYFYLLRTFDEVPVVFSAINDDNEVRQLKATPQPVLLDSLVSQLEYVTTTNMTQNFGNASDNKGLITDKAVHAILADIYLWRGSYYETRDKAKADSNYQACINHCDRVLELKEAEYQKNLANGSMRPSLGGSDVNATFNNPYHLIVNSGTESAGLLSNAYNEIFGDKNSYESIFELQFDGEQNKNNIVTTFYRTQDKVGNFYPSKIAKAQPNGADVASALYSKTDLRRWATIQKNESDVYAIVKFAATSVEQFALADNTEITGRKEPTYSLRSSGNANWIFYRLTDVLLMKAEAMCMIGSDLNGAFELVKMVNDRSNPYAKEADKLQASAAASKAALEGMILRERNREFFGEGKRWFDLVRYAMRKGEENGPAKAFEIFGQKFEGSLTGLAKNKYKQSMKVMFAPYAESEIKANTLLVQNPIWNDQSSIQKK